MESFVLSNRNTNDEHKSMFEFIQHLFHERSLSLNTMGVLIKLLILLINPSNEISAGSNSFIRLALPTVA